MANARRSGGEVVGHNYKMRWNRRGFARGRIPRPVSPVPREGGRWSRSRGYRPGTAVGGAGGGPAKASPDFFGKATGNAAPTP